MTYSTMRATSRTSPKILIANVSATPIKQMQGFMKFLSTILYEQNSWKILSACLRFISVLRACISDRLTMPHLIYDSNNLSSGFANVLLRESPFGYGQC